MRRNIHEPPEQGWNSPRGFLKLKVSFVIFAFLVGSAASSLLCTHALVHSGTPWHVTPDITTFVNKIMHNMLTHVEGSHENKEGDDAGAADPTLTCAAVLDWLMHWLLLTDRLRPYSQRMR